MIIFKNIILIMATTFHHHHKYTKKNYNIQYYSDTFLSPSYPRQGVPHTVEAFVLSLAAPPSSPPTAVFGKQRMTKR